MVCLSRTGARRIMIFGAACNATVDRDLKGKHHRHQVAGIVSNGAKIIWTGVFNFPAKPAILCELQRELGTAVEGMISR